MLKVIVEKKNNDADVPQPPMPLYEYVALD